MAKERIDNVTAGFMGAVSGLFDLVGGLINFIPVVGQIGSTLIMIFGFLVMGFWLVLKGVKLVSGKTATTGFVSVVIEAIPILNALPALTFFVVRTILMVKSEDKLSALTKLPVAPKFKKMPLGK